MRTRTADDYVLDFRHDDGGAMMTNFHGISWYSAPAPRRWHRCRPQSEGFINYSTVIQRCACGAISIDGGRWMGRNSKSGDRGQVEELGAEGRKQ